REASRTDQSCTSRGDRRRSRETPPVRALEVQTKGLQKCGSMIAASVEFERDASGHGMHVAQRSVVPWTRFFEEPARVDRTVPWSTEASSLHGTRIGSRLRTCPRSGGKLMLSWAILFLVVAIVAGVLGFSVIAGTAAWIAKVLFVVFLIAFVVALILRRRVPTG